MRSVLRLLDITLLALHSLTVHKVRTFLTALGIIFGVMGVIATLAISAGGSYQAQQILRELGSDNIIIDSQKPANDQSKASNTLTYVQSYGLTNQDVQRLLTNIPDIRVSAIVHRQRKLARVDQRSLTATVMGTEVSYMNVARIQLVQGRFLAPSDMAESKTVCVITQSLARRLFLFKDPMNKFIVLGGQPFSVIGIIEKVPATLSRQIEGGSDDCIIIPLSADRSRFGELTIDRTSGSSTSEHVHVSQIVLQMKDERALMHGAIVARNLLERGHGNKMDYAVTIPQELLEQQARQRKLWNMVFLTVSLIALVVGGIGIMNIMLATVTERTREIGVRRALGATRADIVVQFLVEAVTLSSVGGLLGIGAGLLVPWIIEKSFNIPAIISTSTILLPLLVSISVGLLSGLYPAVRAARLDPIVALRHE